MIDVLGLPIERATQLLEQAGYAVSAVEARSKKGVDDGSDARVIRQDRTDETHITLMYAVFRTKPNE
ncbi:MAG: hypothetical protein R2912_13630 [Eubacteriales bacterium]